MLAASLIMGLSYASRMVRRLVSWRATSSAALVVFTSLPDAYAPLFWCTAALQCDRPAGVLVRAACGGAYPRQSSAYRSVGINIGMWLERILIVMEHAFARQQLPSMWRLFVPTMWDWAVTGSVRSGCSLFSILFLSGYFPIVSIHEVRLLRLRGGERMSSILLAKFPGGERTAAERKPGRPAERGLCGCSTPSPPFPIDGAWPNSLDDAKFARACVAYMFVAGAGAAAHGVRASSGTAP